MAAALAIASIGYERATVSDLIAALGAAGITCLVDVRDLPVSRRKGFAKTALAAALAEAGLGYRHLKALGNPKPGRDAARAGRIAEYQRLYRAHLASEIGKAGLAELVAIAEAEKACLMCLERDPARCHRSLILDALAETRALAVEHLFAASDSLA